MDRQEGTVTAASVTHYYIALFAIAVGIAGFPQQTFAQSYPSKPLRIIVPVAAGGNLDIVTRSIGQKLTEQMGQAVVVENRLGASGSIGSVAVAKAAPDGYTLLAQSNTFLVTPAIISTAGYDPVKDFTCVTVFAYVPQILVTNPALGVNSTKELVDLAKRRPGELTYGTGASGGIGHITTELFDKEAGIKMIHVPYKGNAPALTDVLGGQISLMFDTISTSIQYVKSGKLKALGVTSSKPSPIFPDLPTIGETLPGFEAIIFNAMFAPAGTPTAVIERLHAEIAKAVQQADLRQRFAAQGVELSVSESPGQCNTFMRTESEKYVRIVREAGIRSE